MIEQGKSRFYIRTFGCQMNVNDSEKVAGLLAAEGHTPVASPAEADFVFINTCAVRQKAARKLDHSLAALARLKARNPDLLVGVGGCVAQLEGSRLLERRRGIDVLVGTHTFGRVPALLSRARRERRAAVDLDRAADAFAVPGEAVAHGSPVRAFVTIMEGCNHVCSFCVVPRTRGVEVNRPPGDVVGEVESLVARGYGEVTLLGQTVNAYRHGDLDFAGLLARVAGVPGLSRLRFTTSHPSHVTPALARALRDLPQLCPNLHLPFQSGSDRILESMRRGYTRRQYLDIVQMLRRAVPDLALTSDVIVGYPGETEADFQDTLGVVEEIGFDGLFVFMYSPRPGTTAWRQADPVPEQEKRRRLHVLNEHQQRSQLEVNGRRVGLSEEVLVDTAEPPRRLSGRTRQFRIVHFQGPEELLGRLVRVEITAGGANSLRGRLAQPIH